MRTSTSAFSAEYDQQQLNVRDPAADSFRHGHSFDAAPLRGAQLQSACYQDSHIAAILNQQQQQQPSAQDHSRGYSACASHHYAAHMQQAACVTRQGSACLLRSDSSSSSYSAPLPCMPDIARHSSGDHELMTMHMIDTELMQLLQVGGSLADAMRAAYARLSEV
jgi:hypothetical protein